MMKRMHYTTIVFGTWRANNTKTIPFYTIDPAVISGHSP